jgi:hypothetical protein
MPAADAMEWDDFLDRSMARMTLIADDVNTVPFELFAQVIVRLMGSAIASAVEVSDHDQTLIDALNEIFAEVPSFRWRLVGQH